MGEHIALIDFIRCLQRRKLLDSGDYIVISVDDEIYDPNRRIKIIRRGKAQKKKSIIGIIKYFRLPRPFLKRKLFEWKRRHGFQIRIKTDPFTPPQP